MSQEKQKLETKQTEGALNIKAAKAALVVASILIAVKAFAFSQGGSVALLGSLIDSLLDLMASLVSFFAVKYALVPADDDHRFGHGKAEALSGVIQAVVIFLSALFLIYESIKKIITPEQVKAADIGMVVMVISIILTLILVSYQKHVVSQTSSVAIEADSLHYTGDLLMNALVIIALYLGSRFGMIYADPIFGFFIAFYLIYNVWQLARKSIDILMDKEMDEEVREIIIQKILNTENVINVEEIRTRTTGKDSFIQFHLKLDSSMSLKEAHDITDLIEEFLKKDYPDMEVLIHPEPV